MDKGNFVAPAISQAINGHRPVAAGDRLGLSVTGLIESVGIKRTKIYDEIAAGRLIAHKLGRRTFFLIEDVRRWLASTPAIRPAAGTVAETSAATVVAGNVEHGQKNRQGKTIGAENAPTYPLYPSVRP